MKTLRLLGACIVGAGLLTTTVLRAQEPGALRPAVGNPLVKARSLMAAHNYAAATAQVNAADRVKGKTAYEDFVIEEMRGSIAQASGDTVTAMRTFETIINSGRVAGPSLTNLLMAETSLAYQAKNYPATISWAARYAKAGGKDASIRTLVIQSYYLQKDYANAAVAQQAEIDQESRGGKAPPEDQLQLLAACQIQTRDNAGLAKTMETLVTFYPKKDYWAHLIHSLRIEPGFSDRLELDVDRFALRTGVLTAENDFMQMAQLYLSDAEPGGARSVVESATALHSFGPGPQAEREGRLIKLVNQTVADTEPKLGQMLKDARASSATTSDQIYGLGASFAASKQYGQGIALMQEAIAKGDLRRPAEARLRLGETYVDSGDKVNALAAFRQVPATDDGTSDLARLWGLWLKGQPTLQPS